MILSSRLSDASNLMSKGKLVNGSSDFLGLNSCKRDWRRWEIFRLLCLKLESRFY
jgi:hypothetical protein